MPISKERYNFGQTKKRVERNKFKNECIRSVQ